MDSTVILGLAGVAGTLAGAFLGYRGAVGAARVTSRGQTDVAEQRARRQAYYACSTSLRARRDAADTLLDSFRVDNFDLDVTRSLLQRLDSQRDSVARSVGAVAVEGPYEVASSADHAARAVEGLAERLRDWVGSVVSGEEREDLVRSQIRYARQDQLEVEQQVDGFADECRKVLHPTEVMPWERSRSAWRRLRFRRRY